MALIKSQISENGIPTVYHKIDNVNLNHGELSFLVYSYVEKKYRDLNAEAATVVRYEFNCSIAEEESMGIRQLCYTKLKELEDWQEAVDC